MYVHINLVTIVFGSAVVEFHGAVKICGGGGVPEYGDKIRRELFFCRCMVRIIEVHDEKWFMQTLIHNQNCAQSQI
jgi:hypothetical protein